MPNHDVCTGISAVSCPNSVSVFWGLTHGSQIIQINKKDIQLVFSVILQLSVAA